MMSRLSLLDSVLFRSMLAPDYYLIGAACLFPPHSCLLQLTGRFSRLNTTRFLIFPYFIVTLQFHCLTNITIGPLRLRRNLPPRRHTWKADATPQDHHSLHYRDGGAIWTRQHPSTRIQPSGHVSIFQHEFTTENLTALKKRNHHGFSGRYLCSIFQKLTGCPSVACRQQKLRTSSDSCYHGQFYVMGGL